MKRLAFALLILISYTVNAQDIGGDYYVAPDGSDLNPGTYDQPFGTWQKAFDTAQPGDIVYFRGGTYYPKTTAFQSAILLIEPYGEYHYQTPHGHSGTADKPIQYLNYPGETPVLDCKHIPNYGNYLNGISLQKVHYIKFRGLEIRNIYQGEQGVSVNGISTHLCSNLVFENMSVHDIGGRGMWLTSVLGYLDDTSITTDTTKVINCDFYNCADTLEALPFNMGDGIKGDLEAGGVFIIDSCRFWNCSDDGIDLSGAGQKILNNCWAFEMGVNYSHIYVPDDGNGFKLGGVRDSIDIPNWIMSNCISAGNLRFAIHMLDYDPYYRNNARVYNSIFYKNAEGPWSFENVDKHFFDTEFYNCISYQNNSRQIGIFEYTYPLSNNNWDIASGSIPYKIPNDVCTVTDEDFISVDIKELAAPRKANGSLPDVNFFKPVTGSDLIDTGIDIGLSYNGKAPDIGVFEYSEGKPTARFSASTTMVDTGESITFDASESSDDGSIVSYKWTFGDNSTASGVTANHTYSVEGEYTVQLTITDNEGNTATASKSITVNKIRPLEIISYSPNPTKDDVTIVYYSPETVIVDIVVKNSAGTVVQSTDHKATSGNNNQVTIDLSGFQTGNYTITLNDGTSSVSCQVTKEEARQLEITSYSPNPTTGNVTLIYYSPRETVVNIKVFNSIGVQELSFPDNAIIGENNSVDINLTGLASGIYTIQLNDGVTNVTCYVTLQENVPPRQLEIINFSSSTYDLFEVTFYCPGESVVSIEIFNTSGQKVLNQSHNAIPGNNTLEVDLTKLPAGDYRVTLYDGTSSDECNVTKMEKEIEYEFKYLSSSPNPTVDLFAIEITCPKASALTITIIDESGRVVLIEEFQSVKGYNKPVINLSELDAGNYTITISNDIDKIQLNVTKQSFYQ